MVVDPIAHVPQGMSQAPKVVAPQTQGEPIEAQWLRVAGQSSGEWLAHDEGQRRFRLQAASAASQTPLTTTQRESLLQRLDAYAARESGEPAPVYRGVPVVAAPETKPAAQAQPQQEPPSAGPSTGRVLAAAAAGLVVVAIAGSMLETGRSNPTRRKKKSWWARMWSSSPTKRRKSRRRS